MKKNKGITLIALVITIIVLLILAAVTVATLTGENGLLGRANIAGEETKEKTAKEKMNLKITTIQMKSYAETQTIPTLQYVADELCEDNEIEYVHLKQQQANLEKIIVGESDSILTKMKAYSYEFEIDSALRLASIDGIEVATGTGNDNPNNSGLLDCEIEISDKGILTVKDIQDTEFICVIKDGEFLDITKNNSFYLGVTGRESVDVSAIVMDDDLNIYKSDEVKYSLSYLNIYNSSSTTNLTDVFSSSLYKPSGWGGTAKSPAISGNTFSQGPAIGSGPQGTMFSNDKIDLTGINTIEVGYSNSSSFGDGYPAVTITAEKKDGYNAPGNTGSIIGSKYYTAFNSSSNSITVNVSDLTGEYYLAFPTAFAASVDINYVRIY